ncbi:MAG: hypothetical protein ABH807_01300 [Candidatus Shapirobacteria bacterium]
MISIVNLWLHLESPAEIEYLLLSGIDTLNDLEEALGKGQLINQLEDIDALRSGMASYSEQLQDFLTEADSKGIFA